MPRCQWTGEDPAMIAYHDREWGVPLHDDRALFELLTIEGAQAGLSWRTVLHKRDRYRQVFDHFDPERIARYNARKIQQLLADPGIIRNRLKIQSVITNARAVLALREQGLTLDGHLWSFVAGAPIVSAPRSLADLPARTPASDAMSKDLARRGFKFVGSTICYAFMQAAGLVNDHLLTCDRRAAIADMP